MPKVAPTPSTPRAVTAKRRVSGGKPSHETKNNKRGRKSKTSTTPPRTGHTLDAWIVRDYPASPSAGRSPLRSLSPDVSIEKKEVSAPRGRKGVAADASAPDSAVAVGSAAKKRSSRIADAAPQAIELDGSTSPPGYPAGGRATGKKQGRAGRGKVAVAAVSPRGPVLAKGSKRSPAKSASSTPEPNAAEIDEAEGQGKMGASSRSRKGGFPVAGGGRAKPTAAAEAQMHKITTGPAAGNATEGAAKGAGTFTRRGITITKPKKATTKASIAPTAVIAPAAAPKEATAEAAAAPIAAARKATTKAKAAPAAAASAKATTKAAVAAAASGNRRRGTPRDDGKPATAEVAPGSRASKPSRAEKDVTRKNSDATATTSPTTDNKGGMKTSATPATPTPVSPRRRVTAAAAVMVPLTPRTPVRSAAAAAAAAIAAGAAAAAVPAAGAKKSAAAGAKKPAAATKAKKARPSTAARIRHFEALVTGPAGGSGWAKPEDDAKKSTKKKGKAGKQEKCAEAAIPGAGLAAAGSGDAGRSSAKGCAAAAAEKPAPAGVLAVVGDVAAVVDAAPTAAPTAALAAPATPSAPAAEAAQDNADQEKTTDRPGKRPLEEARAIAEGALTASPSSSSSSSYATADGGTWDAEAPPAKEHKSQATGSSEPYERRDEVGGAAGRQGAGPVPAASCSPQAGDKRKAVDPAGKDGFESVSAGDGSQGADEIDSDVGERGSAGLVKKMRLEPSSLAAPPAVPAPEACADVPAASKGEKAGVEAEAGAGEGAGGSAALEAAEPVTATVLVDAPAPLPQEEMDTYVMMGGVMQMRCRLCRTRLGRAGCTTGSCFDCCFKSARPCSAHAKQLERKRLEDELLAAGPSQSQLREEQRNIKGIFKEDAFHAIGDTATVWCFMDFLCAKSNQAAFTALSRSKRATAGRTALRTARRVSGAGCRGAASEGEAGRLGGDAPPPAMTTLSGGAAAAGDAAGTAKLRRVRPAVARWRRKNTQMLAALGEAVHS